MGLLQKIFSENSTHKYNNNLGCIVVERESLQPLMNNKTPFGPLYAQAIKSHASDVAFAISPILKQADVHHIAVVDIPRGGLPVGQALKATLPAEGFEVAVHHSLTKLSPERLYDPSVDWGKYDCLIIADGVIGSGKTIVSHIEQAPARLKDSIIVFSNVTSELGAKVIGERAERQIPFVTGMVIPERDCEWVKLDQDKLVYFIGYNKARNVDYNLPDFGDAIQPK